MGLFDKLQALSGPAKSLDPEEQCSNEELKAHGLTVMEQLRALGDQKHVNPPSPPTTAAAPEPAPVVEEPKGETQCPMCGKMFRHLSRHKCKGSAQPEEPQVNSNIPTPVPALGFILVLDALFEKNNGVVPQLFSDIIAPLMEMVAAENKVEHWGAVDYGRGGPLLAAKLEKWLMSTQPQGIILADSSTPELRAVKEVLKRAAKVVIQGVR